MINKNEGLIGFLDSGVGGISVLNEAVKLMPNEKYLYFGDSKNAPYGNRTVEEVKELTEKNVEFLIENGAKAVVIACNTATSAAAAYLRAKYQEIPIIGVEPALKPAALEHKGEKVLVMATSMTLAEKKFKNLMRKYEKEADIVPIPCPGLMEFVEQGKLEGKEIETFLAGILTDEMCAGAKAVVLGCTHYPFIKETIRKAINHDIDIYDGGNGTARQLKRRLAKAGLLREGGEKGALTIMNSLEDKFMLDLSYRLAAKL